MKSFWKTQILEMFKSDIFCVKLGLDHDHNRKLSATLFC